VKELPDLGKEHNAVTLPFIKCLPSKNLISPSEAHFSDYCPRSISLLSSVSFSHLKLTVGVVSLG